LSLDLATIRDGPPAGLARGGVAVRMPDRHRNGTAEPVRRPSVDLPADAETARLLAERTRAGLWIMLVGLGVLWATDVSLRPEVGRSLALITGFQVGCVALGFVALRFARRRRVVATIPVAVLAGIFAAGVVSDVISSNPHGNGLSSLVTCLIAATLMPWGAGFQSALVVVTAIPGMLSVWLCTGSVDTVGYVIGPATIVFLASIGIAHAFERARRERARIEADLRLLQTVGLEVGAAPDPTAALGVVLRRICEAAGWTVGQAWTPRADGSELECTGWWAVDSDGATFHAESRRFTFRPGEGLPGRVWASGQPSWVRDVRVDPNFPRAELARQFGLSAGVGVPVLADGEVIVVLEFFVAEAHHEDAHVIEVLAGAAVQLGAVLQRKRAEHLAEEAAQTAAALVEVGQTLAAHLGKPDMLARVTTLAFGSLGCDWSATFMWDERHDVLRLVASAGFDAAFVEMLEASPLPATGFGLDHDGATTEIGEIRDVGAAAAPVPRLVQRLAAASVLYAPIRLGGTTMGLQVHGYRGRTGPFAAKQRRLAAGVADATAIAVANARLIDDLQASSRLKSEFVATMSHELRTPLNIIVGYSDMLAEGVVGSLTREQLDTVERVQRAGVELLDLVNATLDMGRIEAGRDPVAHDEVDLDAVFRQLEIELGPLVAPGVALRWQNLIGSAPVVTDRVKLKTVVKNLVGNALKFTTSGSVDVLAHWEGDRLRFEIRDTGIGISPESLPVIFEMFRQGDGSSTRTFGGVGLGLHIVRRLVDLLGGEVSVESTVGSGSTFVAVWPASPADSAAARSSVA